MEENVLLLEDARALINRIKMPLGAILRDSESRFVMTGQDLQSIYSDAEGLTRMTMETAGMISGDADDRLLPRIGRLATEALSRLEAFTTEVSGIFPRFETCINQMKTLNERCPGIIKIAKTLHMISLNISTESSRSQECEEMFGIFVKEIRELAGKVNDISHRIKEDSEKSGTVQEKDFSRILGQGNELNLTADKARGMVSENMERIDDIMKRSLQTLQRSESHSQRISDLVGEIVVAIQFHDIARQQVEHVIEALQDIEGLIDKDKMSGVGAGEDSILLEKVHSILRLQASQVEQVISEIREAHVKITGAFDEIGNEIEALVNNVSGMGSGMMEEGSRENAFNLLLSGFERLGDIMSEGEALTKEIDGTMRRTRDVASGLSEYLSLIEDVSDDLHIKSINALIMSKKLGTNGVTLSVLAQYVTEVSKESDEFVTEVIEILKSIKASAGELSLSSSEGSDASAYQGTTSSSLREGIDSVSRSYEGFLENMDHSRSRSMALKKKIMDAGTALDFLKGMKDGLETCLKDVESLVTRLAPYGSDGQKATDDLSKVQSRYTMEIERGIHEMSVGGDEESHKAAEKETKPDESELGDNVELF